VVVSIRPGSQKIKKLPGSIVALLLATVSESTPAKTYYFHNDHLGTPQQLTDADQRVVWQGAYTPFGDVEESVAIVEQNLRFRGQYLDRRINLHYNYFRDYDPAIGRYLQSDPIGLNGGISTFGYVHQNPIIWTDPYGLFQFGSRPLGATNFEVPAGNVGLLHEHGFFENGTNIGYFPEGIRADTPDELPRYTMFGPFYNDDIMRLAVVNLSQSGNWLPDDPSERWWRNNNPNDYDLTLHNCQDFADALRQEYRNLSGQVCPVPFQGAICPVSEQ
jgi:RHS repeat-associated protein